jgi:spore coat protein U-like protein
MNDAARLRGWARRALATAVAMTAIFLAAAVACAQSCSFAAVSGVSFGSYDALSTSPLDQTGSITFQCDLLYLGTATIDLSTGNSGTYSSREMHKSADSLRYNLYLDAARVLVWGDGTGGTSRFGPVAPPLGLPNTLTIYGRIPQRQPSPVGAYTDSVIATINF